MWAGLSGLKAFDRRAVFGTAYALAAWLGGCCASELELARGKNLSPLPPPLSRYTGTAIQGTQSL